MNNVTGYFGVPGGRDTANNHHVHYVVNARPVCGTRQNPRAEFQFCAHGIQRDYIDCERCLKIVNNMIARRGFTLIELMVTIAIIAILAAIVLPKFVGTASGSQVGVVTSIEKSGQHWNVELSQQGVKMVQRGKITTAEANITKFLMKSTEQNERMAEKMENYQGHVLRIKYHRTGMTWDVESVDDLGLAEQP